MDIYICSKIVDTTSVSTLSMRSEPLSRESGGMPPQEFGLLRLNLVEIFSEK